MTSTTVLSDALAVPDVTPAEAEMLARTELARLLVLLESLDAEDWGKPTACTEWDVRAMTAHQAGAYASGTGYGELIHQYMAALKPGQLAEDAINRRQLADRAAKTPSELIAEIRQHGAKAVHNWAYGFRLFKPLGIPHPASGWLGMRYLMLVVHSRDTWIHRLDICRATDRPFEQTLPHDSRINALVVRDLARLQQRKLEGKAIALELTGIAGGNWRLGGGVPAATIRMDTLDFNIYASGRYSYEQAVSHAAFTGDLELAERVFRNFGVLY